ncbi:CGLD27 family protein [Pseudanabaena sp. PCC 6802]|uniref:CGLD27 family protein n=1 Tax=Pseudanabaena sp. PCC 6802 TaxID=118173 RepID=UPI000347932F|nr:CGLD27 family protein [Pseudanabaena sp. PCC 6802]
MICPVPEEQRPVNEYVALKESFFFRWATLDRFAYVKTLVAIWLAWWIVTGPVAAVSFSPGRHLGQFLGLSSMGATVGLALPLLRLLLGWVYIKDRLQSSTVLYEETGWYDGQRWPKPETDLIKERLLVTYEVQPILNKIRNTVIALASLLVLQLALWQFLD